VVWIPARVDGLHTRTEQIAKSIAKSLLAIEGNPIYEAFFARYPLERYPWLEKMEEGSGAERYAKVLEGLRNPEPRTNFAQGSENGLLSGDSELHAGFHGRGRGRGQGSGGANDVEVSVDEAEWMAGVVNADPDLEWVA